MLYGKTKVIFRFGKKLPYLWALRFHTLTVIRGFQSVLLVAAVAVVRDCSGGVLYHRQHAAAQEQQGQELSDDGSLRFLKYGRALAVPVQVALPSVPAVTALPAVQTLPQPTGVHAGQVVFATPQFLLPRVAFAFQPHPQAYFPQTFTPAAPLQQQYHQLQGDYNGIQQQYRGPQEQYIGRHTDSGRHRDSDRPFSRQHQEIFHYGGTRHH